VRVSKHSKKEFSDVYLSNLTDEEKVEKLGITKAYMELKAKKYGIKKTKEKKIAADYPVIVTETGTYKRSYITYSNDAVVKVQQLREICECNDTEFTPKKFSTAKMTEKEIEQEEFLINKLKRHFGGDVD